MNVKIFKPGKTAMQSGRAGRKSWVLEYELSSSRQAEPLMGWTSSGDTLNQVKLQFSSAEDAVKYAADKGWNYTVQAENSRRVKPRNYGDNFKYIPAEEAR